MASAADAFAVTPLDASEGPISVEVAPTRKLGRALRERVRELFDAECREREAQGIGGELYDGTLFSLVAEPSARLRGRFVAYSEWVAQLREPALREELAVRPLGVTGAIVCGEALWLGLRSERSFLLPGLWELCPSGGVDLDARDPRGRVDPARQLALELEEELGWPGERIRSATPFAFVEDPEASVVDLVYRLELNGTATELRRVVDARENREYQRIEGIALDDLHAFVTGGQAVATTGAAVAPVALAMLEAGGWLETPRGRVAALKSGS